MVVVVEVVVVAEVVVVVTTTAVTENDLDVAVADVYPPLAVIADSIVQVPVSTKLTTPLDELIVQIPVVELEYDLVPELFPTDAVADIVGGVAVITYDPESPLSVSVREATVTEKLVEAVDAAAYPPPEVIDALIVHVPISTNVMTPLEVLIAHTLVVELENDLVPDVEPADGVAVIVGGVAVNT